MYFLLALKREADLEILILVTGGFGNPPGRETLFGLMLRERVGFEILMIGMKRMVAN